MIANLAVKCRMSSVQVRNIVHLQDEQVVPDYERLNATNSSLCTHSVGANASKETKNCLNLRESFEVIREYELNFPRPKINFLANKFHASEEHIRDIIHKQVYIINDYAAQEQDHKCGGEIHDNTSLGDVIKKIKIMQDFCYRKPKPAIQSLATKYHMAYVDVCDILKHHLSTKGAGNGVIGKECKIQRYKLNLLDMIMCEYLQRAVCHSVPLDNVEFQKKAAEVKELLALDSFAPSPLWVATFMRKHGIEDLSLISLRTKMKFNEGKERGLEAIDLLRYFKQQHRREQRSCPTDTDHDERTEINRTAAETVISQTKFKSMATQQQSVMATSISPPAYRNETAPLQIFTRITNNVSYCSDVLKNLEQHFKETDLTRIIVRTRTPKPKRKMNETENEQKSKNKRIVTISEKVAEKMPVHLISGEKQPINMSLPDYMQRADEIQSGNDAGDTNLIIKTEPESEISPAYSAPANNCLQELLIQAELPTIKDEDEEDIKPTLIFDCTEEYLTDNNLQAMLKTSQLSSILGNGIKQYDSSDLSAECSQYKSPSLISEMLSTLPDCKKPYALSQLPLIESPEEAQQLLEILQIYALSNQNDTAVALLANVEEAFRAQRKN